MSAHPCHDPPSQLQLPTSLFSSLLYRLGILHTFPAYLNWMHIVSAFLKVKSGHQHQQPNTDHLHCVKVFPRPGAVQLGSKAYPNGIKTMSCPEQSCVQISRDSFVCKLRLLSGNLTADINKNWADGKPYSRAITHITIVNYKNLFLFILGSV